MSAIRQMGFSKEAEYIQAKRAAAIKYLGDRWVLSTANHVRKKEKK